MIEIERKFLVTSESFKDEATSETRIVQGFLNTHPNRTVRVRIHGNKGILTIKGLSSNDGTSRFEWEKNISEEDAKDLLNMCEDGIIEKRRFEVPVGEHIFEIDVFDGENDGLIVAELELTEKDELFERPDWLGTEVTGITKYYNSQLSLQPFKTWNQ
ncbi:MAG: CYTH domain-containing protein [Flavobacteriaceae bacterium]|nr:CYTH domain-containing protein [Flavobacteriaceae bacterium]